MFNREILKIRSLSERKHELDLSIVNQLELDKISDINKEMEVISEHLINAKKKGSATVLMMGAHVIRAGVQNYLINLMEKGYLSCIAMNGAGVIHDFEFALIGATTESVARYIKEGQFGLWKETGYINDIISNAYGEDGQIGMGKAVGRAIATGDFPYKNISLLACGYKHKIPITVHVGIGYDIIHEHPNCDGAATGALSYNDFLQLAAVIGGLEGGVVMNMGSAVMAPEVYLKALSMARNQAHQQGKEIKRFTTVVCDLHDLPDDFNQEPSKDTAAYYFRPWKTMLVRTVSDGGRSFYIKGDHKDTIPALWAAVRRREKA